MVASTAMATTVHFVEDFSPQIQEVLPGIVVPQITYEPPRECGQGRGGQCHPLMFFSAIDGSPGIRVQDVLNSTASIYDADATPAMSTTGTRVSIRICWPGYEHWTFNNAINLFDSTAAKKPAKVSRIAYQTAVAIRKFYDEMGTNPTKDAGDWNLRHIPFESLYLVELRQVLQASWQPVLCTQVR